MCSSYNATIPLKTSFTIVFNVSKIGAIASKVPTIASVITFLLFPIILPMPTTKSLSNAPITIVALVKA